MRACRCCRHGSCGAPSGFPNLGDEDVAFTERDQAALNTVVDLVRTGKLTEEAAISVTRAIGQMTDRMVVWQIEALVEDMVHEQGLTDAGGPQAAGA